MQSNPGAARRLSGRGAFAALGVALALGLLWPGPGLLRAQTPPIDGLPDPDQLKNQALQALVRLVLDRPMALAQQAGAVAAESGQLAQDLGPRLNNGQGPNGGGVPLGLEVEVGQIAGAAAQCAQQAQQNLAFTSQDIGAVKGVFGDKADTDEEPDPERSRSIVQWVVSWYPHQRQRNDAVDQCLKDSLIDLGRLRAYRSLYPS